MLVILEGPDGAGKTTLAGEIGDLCLQRGQSVFHRHFGHAPVTSALVEYTSGIHNVYRREHALLLDRWHLSEMIYGPMLRGGAGLSATQFFAVEEYLNEREAVVVFCLGREKEIAARLKARGEEVSLPKIRRELKEWEVLMRKTSLPYIVSPIGMEATAYEVVRFAEATHG